MIQIQDIKKTFSKGSQLAKLELKNGRVYWFNITHLSIEFSDWGFTNQRMPLYYKSKKSFYTSIKRHLKKQTKKL
tara:strand:+ start:2397 stop:2621 length:225 start_codon:yes stop_codon:yes gene_type:complete